MNKSLFAFIALLLSMPVLAQQDQGGGLQGAQVQSGSGQTPPQGGPQGNPGQNRPQRFQEMKQHMLDRIGERINALQDAKNCAEQAQDMQALKACRPQREEGNQGK